MLLSIEFAQLEWPSDWQLRRLIGKAQREKRKAEKAGLQIKGTLDLTISSPIGLAGLPVPEAAIADEAWQSIKDRLRSMLSQKGLRLNGLYLFSDFNMADREDDDEAIMRRYWHLTADLS